MHLHRYQVDSLLHSAEFSVYLHPWWTGTSEFSFVVCCSGYPSYIYAHKHTLHILESRTSCSTTFLSWNAPQYLPSVFARTITDLQTWQLPFHPSIFPASKTSIVKLVEIRSCSPQWTNLPVFCRGTDLSYIFLSTFAYDYDFVFLFLSFSHSIQHIRGSKDAYISFLYFYIWY